MEQNGRKNAKRLEIFLKHTHTHTHTQKKEIEINVKIIEE